jgi:hypothetical protein
MEQKKINDLSKKNMGFKSGRAIESSHWYNRDGVAVHQVEMKTKPGEYKNTTIKEARQMKLLPSVTNVLGILDNKILTDWKMRQVCLAAMTSSRNGGESDEDYMDRILNLSTVVTKSAADFGTAMHAAVDTFLMSGKPPEPAPDNQQVIEYWPPVERWLNDNIYAAVMCEYVVTELTLGYAGQVDVKAILKGKAAEEMKLVNSEYDGFAILDFKTRKVQPPKKAGELGAILTYESDVRQLSAYAHADEQCPVASVIIGSNEKGRVKFHAWSQQEQDEALHIFAVCLHLWSLIKNYSPAEA